MTTGYKKSIIQCHGYLYVENFHYILNFVLVETISLTHQLLKIKHICLHFMYIL